MNEQLRVIISAEIDKFKQNVENAQKSIKGFKEQVAQASKEVDDKFKNIGTGIANGAKAAALGVAAVGTALLALGASTQEYRNQQAQLTTAFEQAGGTAEQAKSTYNELYKVLGDGGRATEAAQHLAKLSTNEETLSTMTGVLTGVYATFGDSLPLEGLAEGVNHTAKLGEVQGSLADALEWGGVNVDEFNDRLAECTDEQDRAYLIQEQLIDLYWDAGEAYAENNKAVLEQNDANARLQETMASLGEAMAPVITAFTNFANQALDAVRPYIEDLATNLLPVLKELLDGLVFGLEAACGWIEQNKAVLAVIGGIIAGIVTAIGLYNAVAAVKAAMDALQVTTVWALVSAYAAQAAAMVVALAPYLAIVAAIAAVIAIIVLCVKHWDQIKEAVAKAWEWIKEKTKQAVDAVVNWFNQMKDKIGTKVQSMKDSVVEKFNSIKSGMADKINGAKTAVLNTFDNIKNGIKTKIEAAKNTVKTVIDAIKGFFNFKFSWPNIPMPHFGITPSGWKVGDLLKGSIPKLSIKWYAQGGVFDKPTLFYGNGGLNGMGENGAEAVVPLEKNTQWLDRIAERLNGDGRTIVLEVDGTTFGKVSCQSINQLTKQTGKLPIKVM